MHEARVARSGGVRFFHPLAPCEWPDTDDADSREQALTGAAQIILGDMQLEEAGRAYVRGRAADREAHAALTGALIASEGTDSEVELADIAGVSRPTVRKALGKG